MASPIVLSISKIYGALDLSELDSDEKEAGKMCFGALLYQMGGELDARVLVALFCAGTALPRLVEYAKKRKEKTELARTGQNTPPAPAPVKPVDVVPSLVAVP